MNTEQVVISNTETMLLYLVVSLGFLVTATNGVILGCVTQPCEQICVNVFISLLGYECRCRSGYIVNPSDTSKCLLLKPTCDRGFQSSAIPPYDCVDVDECNSGNSPCEQNCRNSQGSYECSCRSGYVVRTSDPTKCERAGVISCPKGFQPNPRNPTNCIDIDECAVGSPCQQLCSNSKGSYECNCRSGYQINERDPSKCDIINNCQSGYTPNLSDPTDCLDVDECSGSNPCEQDCTNTAGGYVCSCRSGFSVSATSSAKCESVDKCINSPCEQTCTSTDSGYQCSCKRGYVVSRSDPTKCEDVNECSDNPCEHTCTNTQGSFECSCRDGFAVDPNNKNKCTGVDACSTGRRCEHICTIISTGRKCSCKAGYVINDEDPTLCDEVEVCKTKADIFLVFDASASIGEEHFDKQFVFAKRLTSNFKLGPSDVRFGGIVYSRFAEKLFGLKDHNTIETLHKALSNVTYMSSSTYTHEAFLLIQKQQLFSTDKGGREDAPDIVVLLTDGNPTFEDKALESAQILKDSGVLILGVAIGSGLDLSVLRRITSTPSDALEVTSYDTLDYIEKRLTQLLCQVSKST